MAASTDKFKKLSRRWVGQIGAGGVADNTTTTVPLSSTTNLPTGTGVVVVIDRVDANGTATANFEETIIGVVSGSNLVSCVRGAEGTAQAHNAGAVVEVLVTAKGFNDLIDGLLIGHNQDGSHGASVIVASNISGSSVQAHALSASAVIAGNIAASAVVLGDLAASSVSQGNLNFTPSALLPNKAIAEGSTSNPGTTSGTPGTIPEMTVTITTTGGSILALFTGSLRHSDTTKTSHIAFKLDSGSQAGIVSLVQNLSGAQLPISNSHLFTGVGAGSHTVVVEWDTNGSTFTADGTTRKLILIEV